MTEAPAPAPAPLAWLFERRQRPVASLAFLAACWLVTVPSLVWPSLYGLLGGVEPRRHAWQLCTAVLEHGWPGVPGLPHLLLNSVLIVECGVPCERLLGTARFVLLCLAAAAANAGTQLALEGVNGSSLVIWAWGPPLALAVREARRRGAAGPAAALVWRRVILARMDPWRASLSPPGRP